ncbi:hypothetical protein TNCV_4638541 [Trichonephila clavipes]|uniref:Uncharacterized protein n=1 Tax=Trichonephila clavipes TaxID=2585209 RepID=A0A8X7BIU8_TRICX|nr:hypothetical protein TNCV_4638541 [Trichonephila clavipes]
MQQRPLLTNQIVSTSKFFIIPVVMCGIAFCSVGGDSKLSQHGLDSTPEAVIRAKILHFIQIKWSKFEDVGSMSPRKRLRKKNRVGAICWKSEKHLTNSQQFKLTKGDLNHSYSVIHGSCLLKRWGSMHSR